MKSLWPGGLSRRSTHRPAGDLVDPSTLSTGRIFVQVHGEGVLEAEAKRLQGQFEGLRLLGLPVQVAESEGLPPLVPRDLLERHSYRCQDRRDPRGDRRAALARLTARGSRWARSRSATIPRSLCSMVPLSSKVVDRAVAGAFVTVKPARRTLGTTTLKVENHLPSHDHQSGREGRHVGGGTTGHVRGRRVGPARRGSCRSRRPQPLWSSESTSTGCDRRRKSAACGIARAGEEFHTKAHLFGRKTMGRRRSPSARAHAADFFWH